MDFIRAKFELLDKEEARRAKLEAVSMIARAKQRALYEAEMNSTALNHNDITRDKVAYIIPHVLPDRKTYPDGVASMVMVLEPDSDSKGLQGVPVPLSLKDAAAYFGIDYLPSDNTAVNFDTMRGLSLIDDENSFARSTATWFAGKAKSEIPLRTVVTQDQLADVQVRLLAETARKALTRNKVRAAAPAAKAG